MLTIDGQNNTKGLPIDNIHKALSPHLCLRVFGSIFLPSFVVQLLLSSAQGSGTLNKIPQSG